MFRDTQIVLLAAGKGKRMQSDLPKVLVPLLEKPMITYLLDELETLPLAHKPIAIVGHQQELVRQVLGDRVEYVEQVEQLGTGHAVAQAQPLCQKLGAKQVVVLNGDSPFITAETIRLLVEMQANHEGPLSMANVYTDDEQIFSVLFDKLGRVIRGDDDRVLATVEAKDANEQQLAIREINVNCLCFDADWLWQQLPTVDNNNAQQEYYITSLIEKAAQTPHGIAAVIMREFYEDIGINNQEQLALAEKYYQQHHG